MQKIEMLIDLFFRIINFFEFRKNKVLSWIKSPNFNHQIKDLGKNANKINITFIDTDFLVGGSQKITLDIVSRLPINRFKTAYIATECFGMEENWREKFMEVFDNLVDLRMIRNKSVKLLKVLSLFRPDIVIIVNSEIAYSLLPQIKKDLPEVYIIDLIHGKFDEKNRHANSLGSIKNIDMRITGTHGLRKMILDKYYKGKFLSAYRKNISVVRYGTNIFPMDNRANKYYFRDKLNIPHNAFVVSFVAAIAQHKDPLSVIEMGNRLKEDKSVHFILAGDGP
ncbi:MAG: hypothetical protein QF864_01285, partial [SAR202 cluster bacterium]|nr:hypothetical protein [SAR202 cluster bacterium]